MMDEIPAPPVDPFAHLPGVDIDALALVGAFRWGGNRAATKALALIKERGGLWRGGMRVEDRFLQHLTPDDRAQLRGAFREVVL